jgi:hypothetical protein
MKKEELPTRYIIKRLPTSKVEMIESPLEWDKFVQSAPDYGLKEFALVAVAMERDWCRPSVIFESAAMKRALKKGS